MKISIAKFAALFAFSFLIVTMFSCKDERPPEEIFQKVVELHKLKDFDKAYREVNILIQKDSSDSEAYYYKGLIEVFLKKKQEALLSFQKSISLDSMNYKSIVEKGKLKITLGDCNGAIDDCNKARYIKKDYAEIYVTKAHAYEAIGDFSNAIISYETAIKYTSSPELYHNLGLLYLNQGRKDDACSFLRKAGEMGHMESFELIKVNCNGNNTSGSINKTKGLPQQSTKKSESSDIPVVTIGTRFENEGNWTFKGESLKLGKNYIYNTSIKTKICDHIIDKLTVNVKNNIVSGYAFILYPLDSDIGIPGCLVKKCKDQAGIDLVYRDGAYIANNQKFKIILSRKYDEGFGGDRILIYLSSNKI